MAIKAADQITLTDITDAYSVILTSEAYTFVGGTGGAASGATCTTQAVAYCGTKQCTSVNINADDIVCPAGVSAAVANSGTASPTVTLSLTATLANACEVVIPIVVDGITVEKKFSIAVAKTGATGAKGDKGATGSAGKGVKSTAITYQAGTSGTSAPTGTWSGTIPSVSAGQYLWTRTIITYTDNTTSTVYSVGMMGQKGAAGANGVAGKGIKSTAITYQASSSGTTTPTGTWSGTIPSVSASQFLWTRTIITYTDNKTSTSYSVGMMGAKGDKGNTGPQGAAAITLSVTSSNGTVFKNNSGSTVLTAHVYQGGVEKSITDAGAVSGIGTVKWYKGSTLVKTAKTLTVNASDVANIQAYTCQVEG